VGGAGAGAGGPEGTDFLRHSRQALEAMHAEARLLVEPFASGEAHGPAWAAAGRGAHGGAPFVRGTSVLSSVDGLSAESLEGGGDAAAACAALRRRVLEVEGELARRSADAMLLDAHVRRLEIDAAASGPAAGGAAGARPPPPRSCTDWTRLVLLPVLTGHVSSFSPY
jgi:hypothetical protein